MVFGAGPVGLGAAVAIDAVGAEADGNFLQHVAAAKFKGGLRGGRRTGSQSGAAVTLRAIAALAVAGLPAKALCEEGFHSSACGVGLCVDSHFDSSDLVTRAPGATSS
ncbi:MAG: hypothetical protein QOC58_1925 [Mycobacterium sp.]|nr:hypothetical protein [Mycobacterium sp.]